MSHLLLKEESLDFMIIARVNNRLTSSIMVAVVVEEMESDDSLFRWET